MSSSVLRSDVITKPAQLARMVQAAWSLETYWKEGGEMGAWLAKS